MSTILPRRTAVHPRPARRCRPPTAGERRSSHWSGNGRGRLPTTVTCPTLRPGRAVLPYRWRWASGTAARAAAWWSSRIALVTTHDVEHHGGGRRRRRSGRAASRARPGGVVRTATSGPLDGHVARVVDPGSDLVDEQPAVDDEELDGEHSDGAGRLGHHPTERLRLRREDGIEPRWQVDLDAHASLLHGPEHRPGPHLTRRTARHQDRHLVVERQPRLEHERRVDPPGDEVGHRCGFDHPDGTPVVASAAGLDHDRPGMVGGERRCGRPRRLRSAGSVDHDEVGHREPRLGESSTLPGLVGEAQRLDPGRTRDPAGAGELVQCAVVHVLVVEGDHVDGAPERHHGRADRRPSRPRCPAPPRRLPRRPRRRAPARGFRWRRRLGQHAGQLSTADHSDHGTV